MDGGSSDFTRLQKLNTRPHRRSTYPSHRASRMNQCGKPFALRSHQAAGYFYWYTTQLNLRMSAGLSLGDGFGRLAFRNCSRIGPSASRSDCHSEGKRVCPVASVDGHRIGLTTPRGQVSHTLQDRHKKCAAANVRKRCTFCHDFRILWSDSAIRRGSALCQFRPCSLGNHFRDNAEILISCRLWIPCDILPEQNRLPLWVAQS